MLACRIRNVLAAAALLVAPATAQVGQIDPNQADPYVSGEVAAPEATNTYDSGAYEAPPVPESEYQAIEQPAPQAEAAPVAPSSTDGTLSAPQDTLPRDDVFSAAEGVFGKGAKGLAGILEDILREQGEPVAYIAGQEASGAFVVGLRYGSGTMRHRVEGDRTVFWTGPTVGFDAGADANKVFVLVYNLNDTQKLFRRYPSAEGRAYAVGGFTASYLRRGDVVLVPVRLGVGLRLGANVGYMKFREKNTWMPF